MLTSVFNLNYVLPFINKFLLKKKTRMCASFTKNFHNIMKENGGEKKLWRVTCCCYLEGGNAVVSSCWLTIKNKKEFFHAQLVLTDEMCLFYWEMNYTNIIVCKTWLFPIIKTDVSLSWLISFPYLFSYDQR